MLLAALACILFLPVLLVALAWVGARALRRPTREPLAEGRALLDRRLAAGEIDVDEYYEREAALRNAAPTWRGRDGPIP